MDLESKTGRQHFVVGSLDDYPVGSKKIINVGGRTVGIYNSGGTLYSVQNVCAHALAPICMADLSGTMLPSPPGQLEYGMEGVVLRCPWHGWEYDVRTGEALFGTDRRRLATFPVTVQDDKVIITMRPRKTEEPEKQLAETGRSGG